MKVKLETTQENFEALYEAHDKTRKDTVAKISKEALGQLLRDHSKLTDRFGGLIEVVEAANKKTGEAKHA